MTDQTVVQNSLMVTVDEDGAIITFESVRLMASNPRIEVSSARVRVRDDDGLLVDAEGVSEDIIAALQTSPMASLVGIYGGDGDDLFDVRALCPVGKPEDVHS